MCFCEIECLYIFIFVFTYFTIYLKAKPNKYEKD